MSGIKEQETALLLDVTQRQEQALCGRLQESGFRVCTADSGRIEEAMALEGIDLLILGDRGVSGPADTLEAIDFDGAISRYERHAAAVMTALTALLPLMDRRQGRRICSITDMRASNNLCFGTDRYGERMARAARNMLLCILHNELSGAGYTFRIYCDDGGGIQNAAAYFLRDRGCDECPGHRDENRLVMRTGQGREVPW